MKTLPTDYSHQQLVNALYTEYAHMCSDSTLEEGEFTPSEYLTYLNTLTHAELVDETNTDDESFTLAEYMYIYS